MHNGILTLRPDTSSRLVFQYAFRFPISRCSPPSEEKEERSFQLLEATQLRPHVHVTSALHAIHQALAWRLWLPFCFNDHSTMLAVTGLD